MKWFILLLCIISNNIQAGLKDYSLFKENEITFSLLNVHTFQRSPDFRNKIDSQGIFMYNPWFSYRYKNFGLTLGKDSVNSTVYGGYIQGSFKGFKVYDNEGWHWIAGAYSFNEQDWKEAHVFNKVGDTLNFMPYAGLLWKKKITKNVTFNFVITLGIIQFNLGYLF